MILFLLPILTALYEGPRFDAHVGERRDVLENAILHVLELGRIYCNTGAFPRLAAALWIGGGCYPAFIPDVGAIAMGSHTYEWILRHQSDSDLNRSPEWPYEQPVWVFTSRSLSAVPGADIRFVRGDKTGIRDHR